MNDWKTPEFWTMAIVNIASAIVALLAARGLLSAEEGPLWVAAVKALATPIALLVMAIVTRIYLIGQAAIRQARIQQGLMG